MIAISHIWLSTEKLQCRYSTCKGEVTTLLEHNGQCSFLCSWHRDQLIAAETLKSNEVKYLPDCKVEISFVPEEKA